MNFSKHDFLNSSDNQNHHSSHSVERHCSEFYQLYHHPFPFAECTEQGLAPLQTWEGEIQALAEQAVSEKLQNPALKKKYYVICVKRNMWIRSIVVFICMSLHTLSKGIIVTDSITEFVKCAKQGWDLKKNVTRTQRAITSASRCKDLGGYRPRRPGSTIWANALMSWSCDAAHRTKIWSGLGLELKAGGWVRKKHQRQQLR